jgi:hypothetical protein
MRFRGNVLTLGSLLGFSVLAVLFGAACGGAQVAPTPQVSAPGVLSVANDANPDVIWIVRQIDVQQEGDRGGSTKTLFGLFACYRSDTPAAPKCFLASTSWKPEDLSWPGAYVMTESGFLKPQ